jgi:hypothetical protein
LLSIIAWISLGGSYASFGPAGRAGASIGVSHAGYADRPSAVVLAHQRQYVVASNSSEQEAQMVVPHSTQAAWRSGSSVIPQ